MTTVPVAPPRASARSWWSLLTLSVGLVLTGGFWQRAHAGQERALQTYFDYRSRVALVRIEDRLQHYEQALMGVRGLFQASSFVTRAEFATFVAGLKLEAHFPGIQGLGFATIIPAGAKAQHLAQVRGQGFPDYQIRPEGPREVYTSIIYLEPFRDRNLRAFGYDMLSEPVRCAAMLRARDTGGTSLSGKVKLMQETESDIQAGFLMYVPLFRGGRPVDSLLDRQQNLVGWVYAPFRMNDLMHGVLGEGESDLDLDIYDGSGTEAESQLFDQDPSHAWGDSTLPQARHTLNFGGQSWTVLIRALPGLVARHGHDSLMAMLILGGLASALFGLLTFVLLGRFDEVRRMNRTLKQRVAARTQNLQEVLDNSLDASYRRNLQTHTYDFLSPTILSMTGHTQEEWRDLTIEAVLQRIHPDDAPGIERALADSIQDASGKSYRVEYRFRHKDGGYRWLYDRFTLLRSPEGRPLAHLGSVSDISQRKQDEENLQQHHIELETQGEELRRALVELEEGKARYFDLYDLAPVGYCTIDGTGLIQEANLAFAALVGSTRSKLAKQPISNFIHTEDRGTYATYRRGLLETQEPQNWDMRLQKWDSPPFWAHLTATAAQDQEGLPVIRIVATDITARKRGEEELRHAHWRLASIIDGTRVGTWEWNIQSGETTINETWAEILGYTLKELEPCSLQTWTALCHPDDLKVSDQLLQQHFAGRLPLYECEARMQHKSGHWVWIHTRGRVLVRSADGRPLLMFGTQADITERRNIEVQLHQSQKLDSLGNLAGGVAHDMNNVLAAILGLSSAQVEILPPESPAHRAFTIITKACVRGGNTIRTLLGFARQGLVEEKELDLNELVREEARLLERTTLAKVRLDLDLAPDLRPIRGDGSALTHLLLNLFVNAVDAMPENGTLTIRTQNLPENRVEVSVADTGIGMSKEVLEKALNPFFTTKAQGKGTGLGLSIAYRTARAHQGELDIQSEPGQGTTVRLRFPACSTNRQAPEAAPAPVVSVASAPSGLKVLLVDDDELIQSSVPLILEAMGHSVSAAWCGEEGLAQLEAGFEPDVVILDMNMPGLGGAGTLPRLHALHPDLPVIVATGRADQAVLELIEAHPGVSLLLKPFGMKELKRHLTLLVRGATVPAPKL